MAEKVGGGIRDAPFYENETVLIIGPSYYSVIILSLLFYISVVKEQRINCSGWVADIR